MTMCRGEELDEVFRVINIVCVWVVCVGCVCGRRF